MNPSCNPFSPNGQYQQGCGPNQPQSVNLMDQLMGMSESLRQERQRQELMSNMMPVLMGQGAAAPFQQGGGGTYGYGRNPKDRPPLQCYHRCKDGNRCNGPHLAKDCPRAAAESEEDIRAEVERRTKIKEEAVHTTTLKMEPPPPPATLMPYGSAMMMPPPPMPTQHLQQLQMQQVQQQQQLGAQMSAPELAMCTPAPRQMVDQTGAVENMKEMFKESLEELKEDLNSTWEPHFNEVKALSHENAAKGVLIRSELNSLMAKVSESNKQIEILKAGLEGQGTMLTKLQKRAQPADEEDTNIADLAGTPMTNPKTKKKKSKKHATPATAPSGTRSPRLAAKQLARAEGSK